jgi:hypothetical protein
MKANRLPPIASAAVAVALLPGTMAGAAPGPASRAAAAPPVAPPARSTGARGR